MTATIVGTGLCTPTGMTPRDHALFLRAREVVTPAPSPFVNPEDERVEVRFCPWLGARMPLAQRMSAMVRVALHEAKSAIPGMEQEPISAFLCTDEPDRGMSADAIETVRRVVQQSLHAPTVTGCRGDAGSFAAIREAMSQIESGTVSIVAIVAVDSFVDAERLAHARRVAPPFWDSTPPEPGEGAAAIVLASSAFASARALQPQAVVHGAAIAASSSTDDNDEAVDGVALTTVFRSLPEPGPAFTVFGQRDVSGLRFQEFQFAVARNAKRFARVTRAECLEGEIGRLGAAGGLANLVFGIATMRHGAMRNDAPRTSPFYAWAISRDGTRGAAIAAAQES